MNNLVYTTILVIK